MATTGGSISEGLKIDYFRDNVAARTRYTMFCTLSMVISVPFFVLKIEPYLNWIPSLAVICGLYLLYCRRVNILDRNHRGILENIRRTYSRLLGYLAVPLILIVLIRLIPVGINHFALYVEFCVILLACFLFADRIAFPYRRERKVLGDTSDMTRANPVTEESFRNSFSRYGSENVKIFIMKGKSRKHANAKVIGIHFPLIAVTDYLLENFAQEELNAVLVHEYGHYLAGDLKRFSMEGGLPAFTYIVTLILLLVFFDQAAFTFAVFGLLVVMYFYSYFYPKRRRQSEIMADKFVADSSNLSGSMVSALLKLSDLNLVPVRMETGSHPSIAKRISLLSTGDLADKASYE